MARRRRWSWYDKPRTKVRPSTTALEKRLGRAPQPVRGTGRILAQTFWGRAWCRNLEHYHDYANRLPRGRTYLRQGAVVDLSIEAGLITALVAGTALYKVVVTIKALAPKRRSALRERCAGALSSVVELLEGRLGDDVMKAVTEPEHGLFPEPRDIELSCSCPDWASMCKHVAAAMYGVGLRLDAEPRLLFVLRGVDPDALVESSALPGPRIGETQRVPGDLSEIFGVHIDDEAVSRRQSSKPRRAAKKKVASKKKVVSKKKVTSKKKVASSMTRQQLLARGVPASTVSGWLRRRVLLPHDQPGVYVLTEEALECLEWYG